MIPTDPFAAPHHARPDDPGLDFCLWPYARPAPPGTNALRTSALLAHSLTGAPDGLAVLCARLQEKWGPFGTIWGVKWDGSALSWEFYFYDYARQDRRCGVRDFCECLHGLVDCTLPCPDQQPYFMFSVELTPAHFKGEALTQIDLYLGNPGSEVSSGICYGQTATGRHLRNFYFFFDAQHHAQDILDKLTESAFLPRQGLRIEDLLWPEMTGAQTIVIANKSLRDGLYFSRITAAQLQHFMARLHFPEAMTRFVTENQARFAHHLFDVGWDYDVTKGAIVPQKGSFYGLL